jgi:glyoxylase-like metal-dependent hydrolase (beta-lactamase superfamily II)
MSRAGLWLRRIVVLVVILLVLWGAGFYMLWARRESIGAAPPHTRIAPAVAPVRGLSACWIETGTYSGFGVVMTGGGLLVKHPAGSLLIDTGNSMHFDEEISAYPFALRFKLRHLAGQLNPDVPVRELLRLVGEDPAKIRWVVLSHSHLDHAGGLMDLPTLPVLLTQEELQFAFDPKVQAQGLVLAAYTYKFPPVNAPTLKFDANPYEIFDESTDLYGDGSVVVVPLRGHTPGSVGVFVNLDSRRRFFYVGDAVDDQRQIEDRVGKPLILRDTDNDRTRADQIVAKLNQLHKLAPEITILPSHDRSMYLKSFPQGALSCTSAQ